MKYTIVLLLVCIAQFLVAQNDAIPPAKLSWGNEYNYSSAINGIAKTIYIENKGLYVVRAPQENILGTSKKLVIESYNTNMKLLNAEKISLKFKSKKRNYENLYWFEDKLWLITSFYNTVTHIKYYFKEEIHAKKLTTNAKLEKIAEIETSNKSQAAVVFNMQLSKDSSKLLLSLQDNEELTYNLTVFNTEWKEVWMKSLPMIEDGKKIIPTHFKISNNGDVQYLCAVENEKSTNKFGFLEIMRKYNNNQNLFINLKNNGTIPEKILIKSDTYFFNNLNFAIVNNTDLVVSGFYTDNKKERSVIEGICYFRYNINTKEQLAEKYASLNYANDVEKSRFSSFFSNRNRAEIYFSNLVIKDFITRNDGGVVLVAEQFFIEERNDNFYNNGFNNRGLYGNGLNNYQPVYFYHYNDIYVYNINAEGNIDWSTIIPKTQVTEEDRGYYSSFTSIKSKSKLYFVYNDSYKNMEKNQTGYVFSNKNKALLTLTEVDTDGKMKSYPLLKSKNENLYIVPKAGKQISAKELLLYGENANSFQFGVLSLD